MLLQLIITLMAAAIMWLSIGSAAVPFIPTPESSRMLPETGREARQPGKQEQI